MTSKRYHQKNPLLRLLKTGTVLFSLFTVVRAGDDAESKLFNQLYNEIMGATAGRSISVDSIRPSAENEATPAGDRKDATIDPSSDLLQREIEQLMEDVRTRHSDAIRFMQDNNNR